MNIFKNKVGRPSNEILKKRRILKISMFLLIALIASVLTFTLSKINNKKLKGAVIETDVEVKESEEDYEIKNFKKIGDNYYAFLCKEENNVEKYYLVKLNDDYTLSNVKLELEKAQVSENSYDYIDLEDNIYVTEDNKLIVVGKYYIYKYTVNENSLTKESQSEKVFGDKINFSSYSNNKVIALRSDSNKYIIRSYSLDSNTLSSEIEYNIDSTESSNYNISKKHVIVNDDGNYELLLFYVNKSTYYFEKLKIITINSSDGSILNSNEVTNSELNLQDDLIDIGFEKLDNDEFEFVISGYDEDDNRIYKYVSIEGDDVIAKDIEINASDFLDEEYDATQTAFMNAFKSGNDTVFLVAAMTMNQTTQQIKFAFGTLKLNESGNFVPITKTDFTDIYSEYADMGFEYYFYSDGKILVPFWANDEQTFGYFILNYEEKYSLNIETPTNGTVTLTGSDTSFKNGDSVSFTVTPNEGYEIKSIKVLDESNNDITESVNLNLTNNTFNMPNKNVKLQVEFEVISTSSSTSINNNSDSTDNSTKTTLDKFSTNPKTYDDVVKYIIIGAISIVIVGLSITVVIKNKK